MSSLWKRVCRYGFGWAVGVSVAVRVGWWRRLAAYVNVGSDGMPA